MRPHPRTLIKLTFKSTLNFELSFSRNPYQIALFFIAVQFLKNFGLFWNLQNLLFDKTHPLISVFFGHLWSEGSGVMRANSPKINVKSPSALLFKVLDAQRT
jgi:hypothetical protein